ncbi:MAG: sodium:solute symporter [Blastocatellales bacterium]|nr:sodium:solute symporter [Blastocatellales bacterium]
MKWLDWAIVAAYLLYVIIDGLRLTKRSKEVEGYFLANRNLPWWAVGLSVMATQLSAITLVGTTGQAYADGMRFIQFYFGLPLAMIILCVTAVPFFYRARVYTAYEYLERRFDVKTRALTSFCFLISRGLSCGVIVAAPSVILSIVLGWNETTTILVMGLTTTVYTMFGGVQAVTWTDVKQMVIIFVGMSVCLFVIIGQFPSNVSIGDAMTLAGATGKLMTVDPQFNLNETYTLWSGLIGGMFLALAYFGCDQSQVQRYLTARSESEGRTSLLMSAFVKIPMQFLILFIGVMVFVFYQFKDPPMLFKADDRARVERSDARAEYDAVNAQYEQALEARREAAARYAGDHASSEARAGFIAADARVKEARARGAALAERVTGKRFNDVNYVFPTFVTTYMPAGVVGLIIAAIFAAAMSSIAAELNSLATATVIDFYRRHFRREASDAHYLRVSKMATAAWGGFACVVALYASRLGSLIEVVNRFGSYFYGSLLGVFVLAIGTRRATGTGAFAGLIAGVAAVAVVGATTKISFLWYNVVGCVVVVVVGMAVSLATGSKREITEQTK